MRTDENTHAAWQRSVEGYCIAEDGLCIGIEQDETLSLSQLTTSLACGPSHRSGAVCVTRIGQCAFIKFYDDLVTKDALITTRILLRSAPCNSVELTIASAATDTWHHTTVPPSVVIEAIATRLSDTFDVGTRFFATEMPVEDLPSGSSLSVLLGLWCLDNGRFDSAFIDPIMHRLGVERHCRFVEDQESGRYIVKRCGTGLNDMVGWYAKAAGKPLCGMPDREYGMWTTNAYREITTEGLPALHRLSVDISYSDSEISRRDYYRLAIPYEPGDGTRHLFTVMSDVDF